MAARISGVYLSISKYTLDVSVSIIRTRSAASLPGANAATAILSARMISSAVSVVASSREAFALALSGVTMIQSAGNSLTNCTLGSTRLCADAAATGMASAANMAHRIIISFLYLYSIINLL